jgi:hypothetical protein
MVATATETQQRVLATVETTALMLADLDEVAREWDGLTDGERVSWSLDWSNEMSGLERAAAEVQAGILTPAQEQMFRALARRLVKARQLLADLGLYLPTLPPFARSSVAPS